MKFEIGDIVKRENETGLIILATKDQVLNAEYLSKMKGKLLINSIYELALTNLKVVHRDYLLGKIASLDIEGVAKLDQNYLFNEAYEDELYY